MVFYILIILVALIPVRTLPMNISPRSPNCRNAAAPLGQMSSSPGTLKAVDLPRHYFSLALMRWQREVPMSPSLQSIGFNLCIPPPQLFSALATKKNNLGNPAQHNRVQNFSSLILQQKQSHGEIFYEFLTTEKTSSALTLSFLSLFPTSSTHVFRVEMLDIMFYLLRGRAAGVCLTASLFVCYLCCAETD